MRHSRSFRIAAVSILCLFTGHQAVYSQAKHTLYLIPGQGSDYRVFDSLKIDTATLDTSHVHFIDPRRKETMHEYAIRMSEQIDTSQKFSLLGVSLGGMISAEIMTFLQPENIILISSAACRDELPSRYRFQRYLPLYSIVPSWLVKRGAFILQPIVEPDRKKHKSTFISMLKDKDIRFLKRTVRMIIRWEKEECESSIYHIHGDNDHTLPIKHISADVVIKDGSHMMMLTRAMDLSPIIEDYMKESLSQ